MPYTRPHDAEEMLGLLLESDAWRKLVAPALEEQERRIREGLATKTFDNADACFREHLEVKAKADMLRKLRTKPTEFLLPSEK